MKKQALYQSLNILSGQSRNRINNILEVSEIVNTIENEIDRSFFLLHYKWGLEITEIAECFGCNESIIETRLQLVKKKIFKNLKAMNLYE